jgi:signal transduction histidine kinase
MFRIDLKWTALFVLLILLPASILTYLSIRAFRDEQRSALAELNLLIPQLQQSLDRRLAELSTSIGEAPQPQDLDIPQVESIITLDAEGRFLYPRYLPLNLIERSTPFARHLRRAEEFEFAADDPIGARTACEKALNLAQSQRETVEALNGLGRIALALDRPEKAIQHHGQLREYPFVLDADGAHPLTLSYLRLARHLPPERAASLLEEWAQKTLAGEYPLFPGCRYIIDQFAQRVDELYILDKARRNLLRDHLTRLGRLIDLIDIYAGLGRLGSFSGLDPGGASFLVRLEPSPNGTVVVRFDLEALGADLQRSPAGLELQNRGFGAALFDVDYTTRFELQHRSGPRQVVPASQSIYRLSLGIFANNEAFVLRNYRNRNLFIMAGILLLAGVIAGGAYLLLRDATIQIQTARLRSEFVANVSHELRTPLTSIRMYAETLLLGRYRGQEQLRDYLETIMHESQRLSRMVGNVLDFSRMESGRKTYDFTDVDLGTLVQQTAEEFAPLLEERDFALEIDIEPTLPPVRADGEAVATALANLMSNAVKYAGERREISLSVRSDGHRQTIEVADRGIGVPPEDADRIFEKFQRAANAGGTATGTGLGLTLVRGIAQAHGGSAAYRPHPDGGSIFSLALPQTETRA